MARAVRFVTRGLTRASPEAVARKIMELENWKTFGGWGPLPGIREAVFEARTEGVVGTRFRVTSTDGSSHLEEIVEWDPARLVRVRMYDFPRSLARFSREFVETFRFTVRGDGTVVEREFELIPTGALARPVLVLIGWMLGRAIDKHNKSWGVEPI